MRQSGIYCIKNEVTLKVYIGQTNNLKARFYGHLYELRKNKHVNTHLQSSYNKYGEAIFSFTVLEICNDLNEREAYWIKVFNSTNSEVGYNKTHGGGNAPRSDETKMKISKWQTGRKLPPSHVENIRAAGIGRKHSEETKAYLSGLYTGRPLDEETKLKISATKKGHKMSQASKDKMKGRGNRPVVQYDLNNNEVDSFDSAKDAGERLGFWKSDITQCCRGKRKTVKGFIFKYK